MTDSNDIRNDLLSLLSDFRVNGERVETEISGRNSFCLRYAEGEPIFTVTVTYGGALRNRLSYEQREAAITEAFGPPGHVTKIAICENCSDPRDVQEVEVEPRQAEILGLSAAVEPPNYRYKLCADCRSQIA